MGKLQLSGGRTRTVLLYYLWCLFSSCDRNRSWREHVRVKAFYHILFNKSKAYINRDLKDPGEAIPKGTFAAIGTTLESYIVYVIVTGSVAVSFVPDSAMEFSFENVDNMNCTNEGNVLHNCKWGLVGTEYQKVPIQMNN